MGGGGGGENGTKQWPQLALSPMSSFFSITVKNDNQDFLITSHKMIIREYIPDSCVSCCLCSGRKWCYIA